MAFLSKGIGRSEASYDYEAEMQPIKDIYAQLVADYPATLADPTGSPFGPLTDEEIRQLKWSLATFRAKKKKK